jgi:magnesium chelatase subunit H
MGKLSMAGEATGAMAWLKRLKPKTGGKASGQKQMKMLRQMPKLLRFIPGTAQDLRAYFIALQYWLAGSEQNLANMVRMLVGRYADGERRALRGTLESTPPVHYPEVGLYHPRAKDRIVEELAQLPASRGEHRHGRRPGDAVLRARRQQRALRRRAGGARSAGAAGGAGLLERARPAPRDRALLRPGRRRVRRRDRVADRLLARRRPAYNDARAAEESWPGSTSLTSRPIRSSSRRWSNGAPTPAG